MSWENPEIREGVNVSREGVGRPFLRLALALAVVAALLGTLLFAAAGRIARHLPYSVEAAWAGVPPPAMANGGAGDAATQRRLQQLAQELGADMPLPAGMEVRVHLLAEDTPNAFATLGGNIVVTEGLYRRMPSENALAMVLAHELAHLQARDPIAALGGSAVLSLVLAAVGGDAERLTGDLAGLAQLGYSRATERRADATAVPALVARYGHAGGAAAAFRALALAAPADEVRIPTFLSTHPADAARVAALEAAAAGWDPERQPLRPLPRLAPD